MYFARPSVTSSSPKYSIVNPNPKMASKIKTFSFVVYGIVTVLLLLAVLVLVIKDNKSSCAPSTPLITSVQLSNLLNDTEPAASKGVGWAASGSSSSSPSADDSSSAQLPPFEFTGKYTLVSSEHFDEFLVELGIGYFTRLAATRASSEYVITKSANDEYTLKTISTFGESAITFRDGVEFEEDRLDGNRVRTVITIRGNKWIQKQYHDKNVTIVREFHPSGDITVTSVVNGVVCVRKYTKTA